jgi:protein gp138
MFSIQERLGIGSEPIEGALYQWACMMRTAIPGKVVSFDAVHQTCVVQPMLQEYILLPPPATSQVPSPGVTQNIPTPVTMKPIQDVPIIMMRVPGWSITLPIAAGAECLLIFADTCIDGWWETSNIMPPWDRRRHDLSDAFALFGPWSQPKVLSNYSTESLQIRSDDQSVVIDVSTSGVKITGPAISAIAEGGTPKFLVNDNFYQWFITTFMSAVQYVSSAPSPPSNPETTIFKAQ